MMAKLASFRIWKLTTSKSLACALAFFCLVVSAVAQNGSGSGKVPKIVIDREVFDFGQVEEGIELKQDFKVTNTGSAPLILSEPYASCGCTTPKLVKKDLLPGESTILHVIVDTTMKQRNVIKTVHVNSNDPFRPVVNIDMKMDVLDAHRNMKASDTVKIFTDDKCASCHVYRGTGQFGRKLFNADCAMCHGPKAEGGVGPALFGPYENPEYSKRITQVTSFGSKTHRSMPGFLAEAGGPLTKEQIDSIVKYLSEVSEKRKGK